MISLPLKQIYHQLDHYPKTRDWLTQLYAWGISQGCQYSIQGKNNKIARKGAILKNVNFEICGNNNSIVIEPEARINSMKFCIYGDNHKVHIGQRCTVANGGTIWMEEQNCCLTIGSRTWISQVDIAVAESNCKVEIGQDCLFAYDIDIRCSDSHSVLDLESNQRINYAEDIRIGNHVWVAAHACILKGVTIHSDSIVAAGSIVTKEVPSNAIVAGNPARVVKTGVSWDNAKIPKIHAAI
jgi:acetyltransferase-like isoleucine patch superfamily enzyme